MACRNMTRLGDVIELEDIKREPLSGRERLGRGALSLLWSSRYCRPPR